MNKFLFLSLTLLTLQNCQKERPDINTTIDFIKSTITNNPRFTYYYHGGSQRSLTGEIINSNVIFERNKVIYNYYNKSNDSDNHYEVTEVFSLNEIKSVEKSTVDDNSLFVNLKNQSAFTTTTLLDGSSILFSLGVPYEENKGHVQIYCPKENIESLMKAFKNVAELNEEGSEFSYFNE